MSNQKPTLEEMQSQADALTDQIAEKESVLSNYQAELAQMEGTEGVTKKDLQAKKSELRKTNNEVKKMNTTLVSLRKEIEKQQQKKEKPAKQAMVQKMPIQNDTRHPKFNSITGSVWLEADRLSKDGQPVSIKTLMASIGPGTKANIKENTVKSQYARWRKFHGITGRISVPDASAVEPSTETV